MNLVQFDCDWGTYCILYGQTYCSWRLILAGSLFQHPFTISPLFSGRNWWKDIFSLRREKLFEIQYAVGVQYWPTSPYRYPSIQNQLWESARLGSNPHTHTHTHTQTPYIMEVLRAVRACKASSKPV